MPRKPGANDVKPPESLDLRRIANLLALLLVKGENQTEKILTLRAVGYTPPEIAELLGITAHNVSVVLHRERGRNR